MKATAFLVLRRHGKTKNMSIVRVMQRPGMLDVGEARVKVSVEVPDDLFDSPVVTVQVSDTKKAVVAVEDQEG